MRDIRGDLRDRADRLEKQINAENSQFDVMLQLRTKRDGDLQQLRAQLQLVNKLLEFAAWHDNVRANLAARIAVAEVAEISIRKSIEIRPLILWRFPNRPPSQ
jgi:hypothetical protein